MSADIFFFCPRALSIKQASPVSRNAQPQIKQHGREPVELFSRSMNTGCLRRAVAVFWALVSLNLIDERDQALAAAVLLFLFLFCRFLFFLSLSKRIYCQHIGYKPHAGFMVRSFTLCLCFFCIPNYFLFRSRERRFTAQRSNICVWTN